MIRYTDEYIEMLLGRFMNGESTLEEEARLGDYFRTQKVKPEWEEYRMMFAYFDSGMKDMPVAPGGAAGRPRGRMLRVAAAVCVAVVCGVAALLLRDGMHDARPTAQPEACIGKMTAPASRPEASSDVALTADADRVAGVKTDRESGRAGEAQPAEHGATAARPVAAERRRTRSRAEADSDVELARQEQRRAQQEMEKAYVEIAAAFHETAVTELEVRAVLNAMRQGCGPEAEDLSVGPEVGGTIRLMQ